MSYTRTGVPVAFDGAPIEEIRSAARGYAASKAFRRDTWTRSRPGGAEQRAEVLREQAREGRAPRAPGKIAGRPRPCAAPSW